MMSKSNSITYDTNKFSTASELRGWYTGTVIWVKTHQSGEVNIVVDGVLQETATSDLNGWSRIILPSGNKYIQIVQVKVNSSSFTSAHLESVWVDNSLFTNDEETNVTNRLFCLGDSITQGSNDGEDGWSGFGMLFRRNDSLNSIIGGYTGAKLFDVASDSGKLSTTMGWMNDAFSNVTGDKKMLISLGTNDWGLDTRSAASMRTYMDDLLDEINSEDSDVEVFVLSPLNRTGEDSLLADYRTEFSGSCSSRAWATYIEGDSLIDPATETSDGLHPNKAAHLSIYNDIKSTITA